MSNNIVDNQENMNVPISKRVKVSDVPGLAGRRTVLGVLNSTANIRIQPRRAAKQGVYDKWAPRLAKAKQKSFASNTSGIVKEEKKSFLGNSKFVLRQKSLLSSSSSDPTVSQKPSFSSSTASSGFTIYSDSDSLASTSTEVSNNNRHVLRPPSSFTSSRLSICSETSNEEASYLSSLAAVPALPITGISNSTTLSSRIKQSLKVSVPGDNDASMCDKENVYFKPKLAVPVSSVVSTSESTQKDEGIVSLSKVRHVLSSRKFPKWSETGLREDEILNRRIDSIWVYSIYATEIYAHLRRQEMRHRPKPNYIMKQAEITTNMRWILIDWLVEVASEYELHSQTLYLAVSYVDRFLSFMSVKRDKLQLVGTTAMFIAAKYEEIYPPEAKQFAYITDSTYRISQIIKMEQLILRVLNFDISSPTILEFVDNFTKMCHSEEKTVYLCKFVSELSMLDCDPFLRFTPSMIAASALALANYNLYVPVWPEVLRRKCGYELDELRECYVLLNRSFSHAHEFASHSIREKYRANRFECVADIIPRRGYPFV